MRYSDREPVVRFIDRKYNQITTGQYYISTIISHNKNAGLDLDGGVPEWKVDPESTARAIEICEYYKNNNISVISNFIEPWEIEYDKKNYVLSKLQAAGIEVVTDKEQFDKILESQTILQKMLVDISEFDNIEKEIDALRNANNNLKDDNAALVREQDFIDFQTSLIACKRFIKDLPEQKLPEISFDTKNDKEEDLHFIYVIKLQNDELILTTPINSLIYNFETKTIENTFALEKFKDANTNNNYCELLVNTINKHLGEELGKQRKIFKQLMEENAVLSGKSLDELSEEETNELKEKLKEQEYENVEGIFVHKDKKIAVTPDVYVSEIQNAKLLVDHDFEVYLLPENFAFKKKNEFGQNESYSTPDTLTNNDFLELKTTKKKIGERFGESVSQANHVLIRIKDDIPVYKARKRIQEKINNFPKEKGVNVKDGNIYLYFEKNAIFISAEIKNGKIKILPTLPELADFSVVPPTDTNISQTENKSTPSNDDSISITQMKTETIKERIHVTHPSDIVPYLNEYGKSEVENFGVVILNGSHDVKEIRSISVGTVNNAIAHPREVFKESIRNNAAAVIVFHNHPSNVVEPSDEDIQTTKKLVEAANIIGIPVLDHIIISDSDYNYFSFKENNILPKITQNMTLPDGITYGFAHEGKIYLNPEIWNSEAAVHEYTHLWDSYTQRTNPELWQRGIEIFKNTKLWEEVKADPNYSDIADNNDLVLSEVHARICGKMADKVLERILQEEGQLTKVYFPFLSLTNKQDFYSIKL